MADIVNTQTQNKQPLVARIADRFGVDQDKMLSTLKATAFKQSGTTEVTNEQMMALLVVAEQYGLNPFTRELFAFPDKGGIVPVVSVDGWSRIINSHPEMDGVRFVQDAESCTCIIFRKDRQHPTEVTEYYSECKRDTGPWKSHPMRMNRHKSLIQCARLAFGFAGVFDEDEALRIVEKDITPQTDKPAQAKIETNRSRIHDKKKTESTAAATDVIDGSTGEIFPHAPPTENEGAQHDQAQN